ncbi:hypothetical protein [Helicobacter vulpis]|uniref:hypothetical protein n=1 Tax=Helicobacter vulpis TaxID=2316076 RepID=UPI000EAB5D4B|nr:hypothetical protein [Helicobacter vulpis]
MTHFAPYHFYTGFNRYFYETHLNNHGFEILEISANGNFFEYLAQELHRLPHCANEYAHKKLSMIDRICLAFFTRRLQKLSQQDQGSSCLLNYGLHVWARKVA